MNSNKHRYLFSDNVSEYSRSTIYPSEDESLFTSRQVPIINLDLDESSSPIPQSNRDRTSIEQNIQGLINGCVRSSIHQLANPNKSDECMMKSNA